MPPCGRPGPERPAQESARSLQTWLRASPPAPYSDPACRNGRRRESAALCVLPRQACWPGSPTPSWPSPPPPDGARWASCARPAPTSRRLIDPSADACCRPPGDAWPFMDGDGQASTRAGDPLPGAALLHRRRRARAAGAWRPGGAAAAAGALPAGPARRPAGRPGRVHRARLPQRQARPGPGRGRGRPDRRQHRSGRALGRALAERGVLGEVDALAERIVRLRMLVEATLDFPEEEIDFLQQADAPRPARRCRKRCSAARWRARQGALLREGLHVVLAGQPNVGKSSLLNALAGAELAIVTRSPAPRATASARRSRSRACRCTWSTPPGCARRRPRRGRAHRHRRSWQAIAEADAVVFLHDLTRRGEPDYDRADAPSPIVSRLAPRSPPA
jgi:hypothetical protein